MVAPVTGPISSSFLIKGPATALGYRPTWHTQAKSRYKQKRPYSLPLPYAFDDSKVTKFYTSDPNVYADTTSNNCEVDLAEQSAVYNKAYSRFVGKLKSNSADLGTNLAERHQALSMMTSRLTQLVAFTRALRKLDFGAASKALGVTGRPKGLRANAKAFSNNWLEYHFGWEPMIKDIGNAIDTLQDGIPPSYVYVTASSHSKRVLRNTVIVKPPTLDRVIWVEHTKVGIGCTVAVTNPNLFLANQLGLINPASLAWEVVPFSFVVDWFVNVGEFLSSFTDTVGLTIVNPYVTRFYEGDSITDFVNSARVMNAICHRVVLSRTPGTIPGPSLRVRNPWRLSPTRGLTAATLLVQLMR